MARVSILNRLFTHILFLICLSFFITRTSFNPALKKKLNRYLPDIKYLLLWTKIYGIEDNGQKPFIEKLCPKFNCYLTTNRSMLKDIRYFDGIIFNVQDVSKGTQILPPVRSKYQKYIFAARDSADNYPVCDPIYENFFNWTWTYKTDSTIPNRFFRVYHKEPQEKALLEFKKIGRGTKDALTKKIALKNKAAAIILDKCSTRSKREVFISKLKIELQKYNMTVDTFGKCGKVKCYEKAMKPCYRKLKKYYFYLAMEDSFAEEYVTKTVLHAYKNNAVPIVFGQADYNRLLPPDSYINGLMLGAEKLAKFMYQTIHDPQRYRSFFKWKSQFSIRGSDVLDVCTLCEYLNNQILLNYNTFHSYTKFRQWWNPQFQKRCTEEGHRSFLGYKLF